MACHCTSDATHNLLQKAHLCWQIDSLTEPSSSRTPSPAPTLNKTHAHDTSSLTRPKKLKREKRRSIDIRRQRRLMEFRRKGTFPKFIDVPKWHLHNGRRYISGYRGDSKKICESIPSIPSGSDAKSQIEILRRNGYRIVPAPVYVFITWITDNY
jgi:hypothetical protein